MRGVGCADVISLNKIKKVCPIEFKTFFRELKDNGVSLDSFARFIALDEELDLEHIEDDTEASDIQGRLVDLWTNVQSAFYKKSKLTLELEYCEEGVEENDEIKGPYFCVDGMYQITPAGKKFKRSVKRHFFVVDLD